MKFSAVGEDVDRMIRKERKGKQKEKFLKIERLAHSIRIMLKRFLHHIFRKWQNFLRIFKKLNALLN